MSEKRFLFEELKQGLEESLAFVRGEKDLETTEIPEPPAEVSPKTIAQLRRRFVLTQSRFANLVNVSPKTVQSWEQGIRTPAPATLRLFQILKLLPSIDYLLAAIKKGSFQISGFGRSLRSPEEGQDLECRQLLLIILFSWEGA